MAPRRKRSSSSQSQKEEGNVLCKKCYFVFFRPNLPSSGMAKFATWILILMIILVVAALAISGFGRENVPLPELAVVNVVKEWISDWPQLAAYFMVAEAGLLAASCFFAIWLGNWMHHRQLARAWRIMPPDPPAPPAGQGRIETQ